MPRENAVHPYPAHTSSPSEFACTVERVRSVAKTGWIAEPYESPWQKLGCLQVKTFLLRGNTEQMMLPGQLAILN